MADPKWQQYDFSRVASLPNPENFLDAINSRVFSLGKLNTTETKYMSESVINTLSRKTSVNSTSHVLANHFANHPFINCEEIEDIINHQEDGVYKHIITVRDRAYFPGTKFEIGISNEPRLTFTLWEVMVASIHDYIVANKALPQSYDLALRETYMVVVQGDIYNVLSTLSHILNWKSIIDELVLLVDVDRSTRNALDNCAERITGEYGDIIYHNDQLPGWFNNSVYSIMYSRSGATVSTSTDSVLNIPLKRRQLIL
jgi:hypothetical protein